MINKKLILFGLVLLVLPIICAVTYGSGPYGAGTYGELDTDGDGVPDGSDGLLYNETYVTTTGVTELNVTVEGDNAHGGHNKTKEILFYDQNDLMINCTHNLSKSDLDLSKVVIQKASTYIIVNFSGQLELNKTLYLDDNSFIGLCAIDDEISTIDEISAGCNAANETDFTTCLGNAAGVTLNGITCTDEGTKIRVENLSYSAIRGTTTVSPPPSGGGGGGRTIPECSQDSHCAANHYCFDNKCYKYECFNDSVCDGHEVCWNGRCVKLFDIEIIDFQSPAQLGEFFSFAYLIKGMADFNHDVEVNFQIEKDGELISSGKDTIYLGSFEEKTKTSKLFLPSDLTSGKYIFSIEVNYGTYTVTSHRTIEITVEEGRASIGILPEAGKKTWYIILILAGLSAFLLSFIIYLERKKIKSSLIEEERWIKKHKVSILTFLLFIILGTLAYYCGLFKTLANRISSIPWKTILPYIYYTFGALIALAVLIILVIFLKKKLKKVKIPKTKIKSAIVKEKRWISKYKRPIIIFFLLLILGFLTYYFKLYEVVARRATVFAQWITSLPWKTILPYVYYLLGAFIALIILIILVIIAKKKGLFGKFRRWMKERKVELKRVKIKIPKKKIKIPKTKIRRVKVYQEKIKKMRLPKMKIKFPKIKIKPALIKMSEWVVKYKKTLWIILLLVILGILAYLICYFRWDRLIPFSSISNFFINVGSWIKTNIFPYIYYILGTILIVAILIILVVLAKKIKKKIKKVKIRIPKMKVEISKRKINKIKSMFIKLGRWIIKHKKPSIITFLIIISGFLIYYFKIYEIVAGWVLSLISWISSIPWKNILPYVYYLLGAILIVTISIAILKKRKRRIRKRVRKVRLQRIAMRIARREKRRVMRLKIKFPKIKIKSILIKFGKWIIKHKIPIIIFFLLLVLGFLTYYFKLYEVVAKGAIIFANWITSLPLPTILLILILAGVIFCSFYTKILTVKKLQNLLNYLLKIISDICKELNYLIKRI